jgi:putative hemolysin
VDPDLALILLLLILVAFFAAAETALMSITPAKVRTMVEANKMGAKYLKHLKKNTHKSLITILVGVNFANIAAASLTTVYMTEKYGDAGVGIATGVLTVVVLVFCEVVPKALASSYAPVVGTLTAFPMYVIETILTPLIFVLDLMVKIILRVLGNTEQKQVTDEELIAMASIGAEEGSIEAAEAELIENVLEFNDIRVDEIMTPRIHIDAMPEDYSLDEATEFALNHTHSRIPVYRNTIDNIVGLVSTKDLLKQTYEEEKTDEVTLRQIPLYTPIKVAQSMKVKELFHQFKSKRTHMAIVLDEHGGTEGLITMEDLLEELVGDIEDEQDIDEEWVKKIREGFYEINGRLELDELTKLTGLEFDYPEYKTVNFLILEKLGHLPHKGEKLSVENWEFMVHQMHRHTILKLHLRKKD